ncbi:unnamed protein product [Urochloa humidicola]
MVQKPTPHPPKPLQPKGKISARKARSSVKDEVEQSSARTNTRNKKNKKKSSTQEAKEMERPSSFVVQQEAKEAEDEEDIQQLKPSVAWEVLLEQDEDRDATQKNKGQEVGLDEIQKAWSQEAHDFEANFTTLAKKIHRFPGSLEGLRSYSAPKAVAIGPYHRDLVRLKDMQKVKKAAADHFVKESGSLFKDIYMEVAKAAGAPSEFYASNDVQGMGDDEFSNMMFLDGCFLLLYMCMVMCTGNLPQLLLQFFDANQAVISNDIMLLENQLPLVVLSTLKKFMDMDVPVVEFVAKMGRTLQVRKDKEEKPFVVDGSYSPPHLLGLLWYYKTGGHTDGISIRVNDGLKPMSKAICAIELAEIGIKLKASKTAKFSDMSIKKVPLFTKIFLAPLLLDQVRSSWLVNMVAFEVCMNTATGTRNPVICSYLAMLAMLMDREEDVHKLRGDRIVQGELTNKEMLDFFKTVIKYISGGDPYIHIMQQVEDYKLKWWMWIVVYKFFYKNRKTIAAVLSAVGVLVGILKAAYRK